MQSLGYVVLQNRQSVHFSKWSFKICRSTTVHTGSSVVSSFSEDDSAELSSLFYIETSILRRLAPAIVELVEGTLSSSRINAACSNQLPLSLSARFFSCPSTNCFFFSFLGILFFLDLTQGIISLFDLSIRSWTNEWINQTTFAHDKASWNPRPG